MGTIQKRMRIYEKTIPIWIMPKNITSLGFQTIFLQLQMLANDLYMSSTCTTTCV